MGVSWCLSLLRSANIPALDTCLLNRLKADSIPSFSPTVTCVKIRYDKNQLYHLRCPIYDLSSNKYFICQVFKVFHENFLKNLS